MEAVFEFAEHSVVRVYAGGDYWSGVLLRLDEMGAWILCAQWTTGGYRFCKMFIQRAHANPFAVLLVEGETGKDAYLDWVLRQTKISDPSVCYGLVSLMEDQGRLARVALMVAPGGMNEPEYAQLRKRAVVRITDPKTLRELSDHKDVHPDVKALVLDRLKQLPSGDDGKGPYR